MARAFNYKSCIISGVINYNSYIPWVGVINYNSFIYFWALFIIIQVYLAGCHLIYKLIKTIWVSPSWEANFDCRAVKAMQCFTQIPTRSVEKFIYEFFCQYEVSLQWSTSPRARAWRPRTSGGRARARGGVDHICPGVRLRAAAATARDVTSRCLGVGLICVWNKWLRKYLLVYNGRPQVYQDQSSTKSQGLLKIL